MIFDFDGVLADTEDLHFAAFAAILRREGIELTRPEYYRRYLGLPDRESLVTALAAAGRSSTATEIDALVASKAGEYAGSLHQAHLYSGVAEVIRALHGDYLLAIASGALRVEIESVLAHEGIRDRFAALVGAEDVHRGKPSPDPFLHALEAVNRARSTPLVANECVVIEDSLHGIEAARAAKMLCVAVATNRQRAELDSADVVIDTVTELPQALLDLQ